MAFAVNKAIVLGNAGGDAEVRFTQGGKAVASFSVATSERGPDGQDRTEWHNITAWDKLAELCGRLVKKGGKVYVEGRLQTREYEGKDGNKRRSTDIVAREIVFLSAPAGAGAGESDEARRGGGNVRHTRAPQQTQRDEVPYSDDEDIPF